MKKHKVSIVVNNLTLYGYILKRTEKRVDEFWKKFEKRLSCDITEVFKPNPSLSVWKNLVERIVAYQVYTKIEYSNEYTYDKSNNSYSINNVFLDNCFYESFYLSEITNAIIYKDKNRLKILADDIEISNKYFNRELENAHNRIKALAEKTIKEKNSKIRYTELLRENTFENKLKNIAEVTRKKNGKLNFTQIASQIGQMSHHTVKKWCKKYKIPLEVTHLKK